MISIYINILYHFASPLVINERIRADTSRVNCVVSNIVESDFTIQLFQQDIFISLSSSSPRIILVVRNAFGCNWKMRFNFLHILTLFLYCDTFLLSLLSMTSYSTINFHFNPSHIALNRVRVFGTRKYIKILYTFFNTFFELIICI